MAERAPRHRRARAQTLALLWLTLVGGWASANEPCGRPWGMGFLTMVDGPAVRQQLAEERSFTPILELTDAPSAPLAVLPLLFVDGLLHPTTPPTKLPCQQVQRLEWRDLTVERSLHWLLLALPTVPANLAATPIEQVWEAYADRPAPGVRPILFQELYRPSPSDGEGVAPERFEGVSDPAVEVLPPAPLELDALRWVPRDGVLAEADITARGTIARSRVGAEVPFELDYFVSESAFGPLIVTCLLDQQQVAPFEGRVLLPLTVEFGTSIRVSGSVRAEQPGWSRLQCFMLTDDPQLETYTHWPRPIDAAYLWVDAATSE